MDYLFVDFLEEPVFPEGISSAATITKEYATVTVASNNGSEQRNKVFVNHLKRLSISGAMRTIDDEENTEDEYSIMVFNRFFDAVGGDYSGFRVKVSSDYVCTTSTGYLESGFGTGKPVYQLQKKYGLGAAFTLKPIKKPNPDATLKIVRSGVDCTVGTNSGQVLIDYTKGLVTFKADKELVITNISLGINCVFTTQLIHGLVTGTYVYLTGLGTNPLNNNSFQITVLSDYTFSLEGVTNNLFGTGKASVYPQPNEPLRWDGEFHHAMRFDGFAPTYNNDGMIQIESINLKELRLWKISHNN